MSVNPGHANVQLILMIGVEAILILVCLGYTELGDRHFSTVRAESQCFFLLVESYSKLVQDRGERKTVQTDSGQTLIVLFPPR